MAKKTTLRKNIRTIVSKYIDLLKDEGISVEKAIVFGSFAKGNPKPYSDIDICIVSSQFGKDDFEESVLLARKANEINPLIEPHPYSPQSLSMKYDSLANEIRRYGILVK